MANKRRSGDREAFWRGVLRRQAKSGLSIRAFCRQEELSEPSFYFWRRTIAERDAATDDASPAFLPIVVTGAREDTVSINIELRGGRRLQLPEAIEAGRLAALIHAIEAEPQG